MSVLTLCVLTVIVFSYFSPIVTHKAGFYSFMIECILMSNHFALKHADYMVSRYSKNEKKHAF